MATQSLEETVLSDKMKEYIVIELMKERKLARTCRFFKNILSPPRFHLADISFVFVYLDSKYIRTSDGRQKTPDELVAELKPVISNPTINYQRLGEIVVFGKAKDLREAVECFSLPQIGNYLPLAILGKGGFKTTYLARDEVLEKRVALKIMHGSDWPSVQAGLERLAEYRGYVGDTRQQEALVRAFKDEAQALSRTLHPSLAKFLGAGLHPVMYLAEEYIEGETLEQVALSLGDRSQLTQDQKLILLSYILEVAQGLEQLHLKGIVHLDEKPANIIIHPKRGAVLTDFSSTQNVFQQSTLSKAVSRLYLPPELYSENTVYLSSDLWVFGVMAYFVLLGHHPYHSHVTLDTWGSLDPKDPQKDILMQEIQHNIQKGNYKVPSLIEAYNLGDSFIYENIFLGMIEDCVKIEPTQRPKNAAWLVSGIYNPVEGMGLLVHNRDIDCRTLGL